MCSSQSSAVNSKLELSEVTWNAVLAQARSDYVAQGFCHIPQFLSSDECTEMCLEVATAQDRQQCFLSSETHTIYQEENDDTLPSSHVRNLPQESSKCIVDYERILDSSPLKVMTSLSSSHVFPHL